MSTLLTFVGNKLQQLTQRQLHDDPMVAMDQIIAGHQSVMADTEAQIQPELQAAKQNMLREKALVDVASGATETNLKFERRLELENLNYQNTLNTLKSEKQALEEKARTTSNQMRLVTGSMQHSMDQIKENKWKLFGLGALEFIILGLVGIGEAFLNYNVAMYFKIPDNWLWTFVVFSTLIFAIPAFFGGKFMAKYFKSRRQDSHFLLLSLLFTFMGIFGALVLAYFRGEYMLEQQALNAIASEADKVAVHVTDWWKLAGINVAGLFTGFILSLGFDFLMKSKSDPISRTIQDTANTLNANAKALSRNAENIETAHQNHRQAIAAINRALASAADERIDEDIDADDEIEAYAKAKALYDNELSQLNLAKGMVEQSMQNQIQKLLAKEAMQDNLVQMAANASIPSSVL